MFLFVLILLLHTNISLVLDFCQANAATGSQGIDDAKRTISLLIETLSGQATIDEELVLIQSTGKVTGLFIFV